MKKAISTRIKVTGTGKLLRRKMGQCHFRAKKSSVQMGRKALLVSVPKSLKAKITKKPGLL